MGRADFRHLRDIKKIPYFFLFEIFLLLWARAVVFSSSAERDNCVAPKFLWKHKQAIAPEPFLPPEHAAPPQAPPTGLVLGFLAEIRPLKGLRELVEAMALLVACPGAETVRLRIAGVPRPGSEKYLASIRAFAEQRGLSDHLEWIGGVRGASKRSDFYDSLSLFVCPSKSESFGLTPLEALWHGVPVVMGANIGVRSYIPPDAPVVVFDKVVPEEIAAALRDLIPQGENLRITAMKWRGRRLPGLAREELAVRFFDIFTSREGLKSFPSD
jgi:glycosyltransferase involved in cell wall biosynthesis